MSDKPIIRVFSREDAERLTGISRSQLAYWNRTGFFHPSLAEVEPRAYSFRDLVSLQVLNTLRNESRVSLPHLRKTKTKLQTYGDDVWAKTTLYVLNRRVIFDNPATGEREEVVSGQGVLQIPLEVVRGRMEDAVRRLWTRERADIGRLARKRGVASNKLVVAGTRVPVSAIKAFRKNGLTVREILEQFPSLKERDVRAALKHKAA